MAENVGPSSFLLSKVQNLQGVQKDTDLGSTLGVGAIFFVLN